MSSRFIDLRSDTATCPTPAMREAMLRAEVGDDLLGEDPTVNALLERAAGLFGKEAALFVPSGTQANQIAIKAYTQPGEEVVADSKCHPFRSEAGAPSVISGIQFAFVQADRGVFSRREAQTALRPAGGLGPHTALLWVENTHNAGGGQVFPLERMEELRSLSRELGIPLHMDGARIFNAVVASGIAPREWGGRCDSLSFCLSKGLGCPVGSVLTGSRAFIAKAHRIRKILGGGWRQAGILAAAGLYALEHNVERLAEDHANAQRFAELTAGIPGVRHVFPTTPTNIVFLDVAESGRTAEEVNARLMERGAALSVFGATTLRAVTHLDVSRREVEEAARSLAEAAA